MPAAPPRLPVEAESFVLCIDNEARVREAMAALLGGWGCRVATAATHAEALACVAEAGRLPDLVLADLHLDEGPDGLEVVELLRKTWNRAVPAALITADRDPDAARPRPGPAGRAAAQAGQARRPARPAAHARTYARRSTPQSSLDDARNAGGSARPRASMTAWVRERTPSLRRITVTWAFTVGSPTPSL